MIVAALRDPGGAEIAPAQMRAHGHPGRLLRERRVDGVDVDEMLLVRIAADLRHVPALRRIVEIREAGIVQLQVGAPELPELLDFVRIRAGQIPPEIPHVRIHTGIDGRAPAAVVDHAGTRNGQLGGALGDRFEEGEVRAENALLQRDPARDLQGGGRELDIALLVVKPDAELLFHPCHAAQPVQEVHVPGAAAKFPIGDPLQSQALLHRHGLADRGVLDRAQLRGRDLPRREAFPGRFQFRWAQQAAHMVRPERRAIVPHGATRRRTDSIWSRRGKTRRALPSKILWRSPGGSATASR